MRTIPLSTQGRGATACLLLAMLALPARADVTTRIEFFEDIGAITTFDAQAARVVSDARSIDSAAIKATGDASADLGTGELKARATGFRRTNSELSLAARAKATAVDVITVEGPGTDPIPATFEMLIDGDLLPPSLAAGTATAFASVSATLGVNGSSESALLQWLRGYDAAGIVSRDTLTGTGDWNGAFASDGASHFDLLLAYTASIVPGTPFDFSAELQAFVGSIGTLGSDVVSDFGNTARISIVLPEAYSFTSESGVLLAGPIPEPGTWAMFATGLGCLALGMRRRRPAPARPWRHGPDA